MMSSTTDDSNPLDRLVEEFLERQRRGEHPAVSEYIAGYPELGDEIRELFPFLAAVERFKPGPAELTGSNSTSPVDADAAFSRLGDYRIVRTIGSGGMGVVYEAERESLKCRVALKVMHPEFRSSPSYLRRFHIEARSAARLHHTNIVTVFDYGEHNRVCYYAMQYIAGQSLDRVLGDIRQLRLEKKKVRVGQTDSLNFHTDSCQEKDDDGQEDHARCTPDSLRKTITFGFLTGRYATACADQNSGEKVTSPPSEMAVGTEEVGQEIGTTTRRFVSELHHAYGRMSVSNEPSATSATAHDSSTMPPHDTPSSLSGKADVRYYREVARLGAQIADALA